MFCPNCGTENEETATPCKKCGFKLRGVSAPKFRGTMLLNSEEAVQQLVQEARRRLEEDSSPELGRAAPQTGGQPMAWGNQPAGLRTLNGGLQPPRVASPRVGRTMLGVAPQVGGYTPATPPSPVPDSGISEVGSSLGRAAPTEAQAEAAPRPAQPTLPLESPRSEPLGLDAAAANDGPDGSHGIAVTEAPAPVELADGPAHPTVPEMARSSGSPRMAPDAIAPATDRDDPATLPEPPRRLRAIEIVLVLMTFGLYALVLRSRRRKHVSARAPQARS